MVLIRYDYKVDEIMSFRKCRRVPGDEVENIDEDERSGNEWLMKEQVNECGVSVE